jgi:hypothetical protein
MEAKLERGRKVADRLRALSKQFKIIAAASARPSGADFPHVDEVDKTMDAI